MKHIQGSPKECWKDSQPSKGWSQGQIADLGQILKPSRIYIPSKNPEINETVSCLQEVLSIVEKIKHSKVLPVVRSGEEQFVWEDKTDTKLKLGSVSHKFTRLHIQKVTPGRESGVSEPEGMKYYPLINCTVAEHCGKWWGWRDEQGTRWGQVSFENNYTLSCVHLMGL